MLNEIQIITMKRANQFQTSNAEQINSKVIFTLSNLFVLVRKQDFLCVHYLFKNCTFQIGNAAKTWFYFRHCVVYFSSFKNNREWNKIHFLQLVPNKTKLIAAKLDKIMQKNWPNANIFASKGKSCLLLQLSFLNFLFARWQSLWQDGCFF